MLKIVCSIGALYGLFTLVFLLFAITQGYYKSIDGGAGRISLNIGSILIKAISLLFCAWAAWRDPRLAVWFAWAAFFAFVIGGAANAVYRYGLLMGFRNLMPVYYVAAGGHALFAVLIWMLSHKVEKVMETEIALLQDIKLALWVLISIVSLGVSAILVRTIPEIYREVKKELKNGFYNSASEMYDNGELEKLVEYCQKHLKNKPREAYAFWFLGKAYFQMKAFDKAEEYFNKTIEIYPSWEKEWVGPYLAKIRAARDSSLTGDSNSPSSPGTANPTVTQT